VRLNYQNKIEDTGIVFADPVYFDRIRIRPKAIKVSKKFVQKADVSNRDAASALTLQYTGQVPSYNFD
jgi:hypothetical protein